MKLCKTNPEEIYKNDGNHSEENRIKMYYLLVISVFVFVQRDVEPVRIIWDNSVDFDSIEDEDFSRSDQVRMPNWFFIYPGKY
jgi:hypothetical protein